MPGSAYPDAITRKTATALALAKTFRFDMSDLAPSAFGGTPGQGEWKILQDFLKNPKDVNGTASQARGGRGGGLQEVARELSEHRSGAPVRGGSARSAGGRRPGALAQLGWWRRRSCCPALILLLVWIVYPVVYTMQRSLFDRSGDHFVWFDNYKTLFTTDTTRTAIKNNAIWVAVVPALVTAIGLVFAVLTERVRWAVAFKIAVFMPMAMSLFAAGVIWRIMDQQEPSRGAVNAVDRARCTTRSCRRGHSPTRSRPARKLTGTPSTGIVLKTPVRPGGVALLPLTGIPPDQVPAGSVQAKLPGRQERARSTASCGATSSRAAAPRASSSRARSGCRT